VLPISLSPTPSEDNLFPGLKKELLKVSHFSFQTENITAAETLLEGQDAEILLSGFENLGQRTEKCIELRGDYVE
jgi:hypothetical protein